MKFGEELKQNGKAPKVNCELVSVQGCSFNIRMGGVGPFLANLDQG